jgi:UDP-GlcNAc3NAcA epimerase
MMKICTIVGARPQFIKAAAVSRVIAQGSFIEEKIIHTGQHYDANMSSQFFEELEIPHPAYSLQIGSSSHGRQTGQMLEAIEEVLLIEQPQGVLIYGDTNSTLAGALAAAKLHIPVAHVEAGLRSFNRKMPEEINRIMSDHVSSLLFAPTTTSYQRLLTEGLSSDQIFLVGDVMFDVALYYKARNKSRETLVDSLQLHKGNYVLVTIHRAENTDSSERLKFIAEALLELANTHEIILPLHPRTRQILDKLGLKKSLNEKLKLLDPVGYLDMLALEQHAQLIITDSGGVQKEAYFNQVPCITLRNETEWVELVASGWNVLCPPDRPFSLCKLLSHTQPMSQEVALYGNGTAAQQIVQILEDKLPTENDDHAAS